ncbi:EndoU domain-containing protein [Propionibacterium acidifaciens]|uniref:VG15 protein n=1 Tax=Propionibacterium acidifaciens TaxID=556499 RepID=UPI00361482CB
MVDRADVTRYTDAARAAVDAAERQLAGFLAGLDLSQPGAAEALAAYMEALAQQYGTVAASAAADWYEELRAADGLADGFAALVDDTLSVDALRASTGYQLRNGDPDALASRLGGVLQRHILGAGRQTIDRNMDADPADVRYARIPRGPKTCAFCSMLASRGWVYRSKETASQRKRGGRYHDRCDCAIVPSWSRRTPTIDGYDPGALYKQYQQARTAAKTTDETVILAEMRRQHPDRYTDGVKPRPTLTSDGSRYLSRAGRELGFGPADVRGLDQARRHVIEGDVKKNGKRTGGHLYATVEAEMREGQIAFPKDWDADRIMAAARQVIDQPEKITIVSNSRCDLVADIDGVSVTVRLRVPRTGPTVITVHPNRGRGVKRVHDGALRGVG